MTAPQLLSIAEARKRLGIGERTLYDLIYGGVLPSVKIGRRRLISEAALADYIAAVEDIQDSPA